MNKNVSKEDVNDKFKSLNDRFKTLNERIEKIINKTDIIKGILIASLISIIIGFIGASIAINSTLINIFW